MYKDVGIAGGYVSWIGNSELQPWFPFKSTFQPSPQAVANLQVLLSVSETDAQWDADQCLTTGSQGKGASAEKG